ncbi:MAG TPA: glucose 1-dehydrogenase [Trebonia sp.]|jgi:NAD(P)-dependent dehydrogenase (short-subunit alcohol dehydrogenase family)|nr:glucose 1-dehydrogenase [Trebonia sp.]
MGYADEVFDLTGQVVVVTGGSRGLGREIAYAVARQGANVVIASRKLDNCQQVADGIRDATGRETMAYGVHIGRWDELEPFVDAVYDRFGQVDVLFNNAGMSPVYDQLTDVSEKLFDSVINLNFKGPFRLAALIGERMRAAGRGSIINVSSSGSIRPKGKIVPYAGAKAALNAMSEGLAEGLGPHVRVNTLMPGTFQTDVSKAWDLDAVTEDRKQYTALQRVGQPPEIIGAALFLASDASSYTSGTIIRVDGGMF